MVTTAKHTLSGVFARASSGARRIAPPGHLFGIEQEFEVRHGGVQVDFRSFVHRAVASTGRAVCRAGSSGYYLSSGRLLICDGWEAEVAGPPEPADRGLFQRIPGVVRGFHRELLEHLRALECDGGPALRPTGYSTHLSVSSAGADLMALARLYARTMAPAMMLLLDVRTSPGLLVRARPKRFEIGGDYVAPQDLRAPSLFFAASFLAVLEALVGRDASRLPLLFDASCLEPTRQRCGIYVDRQAFGDDLYGRGRAARLRLDGGGVVQAQSALEDLWGHVRPYAAALGTAADVELVSGIVSGARPLPSESRGPGHAVIPDLGPDAPLPDAPPHPFALGLRKRQIGARTFTPEVVTWDHVTYRVEEGAATSYLNVPRAALPDWLRAIDAGQAGQWIEQAGAPQPLLASEGAAEASGVFAAIDAPALAERFEGRDPGKKKKREDHDCDVVVDDEGNVEICMPDVADSQKVLVEQEPAQGERLFGNGVRVNSGTFASEHADHRVRSRGLDFAFLRYYRSGIEYSGPLGRNWDHAYNVRIVAHPPPTAELKPGGWCEPFSAATMGGPVTFYHGTGRVTEHAFASWEVRDIAWCGAAFTAIVTTYTQNDGESFEIQRYAVLDASPPGVIDDPIFFRVMHRGGTRFLLNCHGRLMEIRDRNHNTTRFRYGRFFDPETKYFRLWKVIDSLGREYEFDYRDIGGAPRIVSLTDPWQRVVRFDYDADVNLVRVTLAAGDAGTPQLQYRYGGGQRNLLREIVDPLESAGGGRSWLENTYDALERVETQRVGSSVTNPPSGGTFRIAYPSPTQVILTDRAGVPWIHTLRPLGASKVVESIVVFDQTGTGGQLATTRLETRFDHDRHYHVTRITHPSGRQERFRFRNRNAPVGDGDEMDDVMALIAHHNDLGRDALLIHSRVPSSGAGAFVTVCDYEWLFGSVVSVQSAAGRTSFTYDHGRCASPQYNGNPIRIQQPPQRLPVGGALPVAQELDYGPGGILKYLRDPDGVEHEWTIDVAGLVRQLTVGGQLVEAFAYTPKGNVETRTDPRGKIWKFDYDERDLLRSTTDPMGHMTTVAHNLNDWETASSLDRVDDPGPIAGLTPQPAVRLFHTYGYDMLGNRVTDTQVAQGGTGALARVWRSTLDAEERVTLLESPRATAGERVDARVRLTYNARGLLASKTTADGGADAGTLNVYYDEDGHEATAEDELGQRTVTFYDRHGRPETEVRPNGAVRHLDYRGPWLRREWIEGPVTSRPIPLGGATVNRVLSEVQFQVDACGRPIRRTTKIFDPRQRPSITSGGGGDWTESTWLSAAGRIKRQQDPAGHEASFDWNPQGRLGLVTLPGGHTLAYRYEGNLVGGITTTLKPEAGVTGPLPPVDLVLEETRKHDDLGRIIRHRTVAGVDVEQAHDSLGNLRAKRSPVLQGEQALTVFEHDAFGRVETQVTDRLASLSNPDARMTLRFQNDLNDNVTLLTDDLGRTTKVAFDGRDLPVSSQQPHQTDVTYRRRTDGSVERIERAGGATTTFRYTPGGAVASARHTVGPSTVTQTFGHDGLDRMLWAADSNGGARFRIQTYRATDSLGRALNDRTLIPEFGFDKGITYRYAPGERRTGYPDGGVVTHTIGGDGNAKSITLSGVGTLIEALHQGPGRVLQQLRRIVLSAGQPPPGTWGLTLRVSQRHDTEGRLNFRALHVTDPILSPPPPGFLSLGTQAEKTTYEANGMPRTRTYGVITQPGVFVDSTYVYDGLGRARLITEGEGQDFVNLDYDLDGTGRLHEFELNGRKAGQIVNEVTTATYQPGQRVDQRRSQGSFVGTTTWTFDAEGRLTSSEETQPAGRREFAYDAANRMTKVDVFTPGIFTSVETSRFLYDAGGRIVARLDGNTPEFFVSDGTSLIAEFDAQQRATRRYVYDERRQLIHYGFRDPNGSWQTCLPLVTAEGSPWILIADRPYVGQLPPPPAPGAGVPTRAQYYRENLPLILEEHRWRPFEKGQVISYDYSSGAAVGTPVSASILPIDTGGRRFFAREQLFANGPRFYDPGLRCFIVPDDVGAWGHPMAFGNPYAYAANNPVAFGDDGNHPVVVGVLVVIAVGALLGAGINAARQGVQLLEGSRTEFSVAELGFSALIGGLAAPAFVFAPEVAIPIGITLALGNTYAQYKTGQIGGWTVAFDVATLALPFAIRGVQAARAPRGVPRPLARRGYASFAERVERFEWIGRIARARFRPSDDIVTLRQLRNLRARDNDRPVPDEVVEQFQGERLGSGRQGVVYELAGADEPLVIKVFEAREGALNNLGDLRTLHLAMMGLRGQTGNRRIRIPRVHAIGRTTSGKSYMIRERVAGTYDAARRALRGPGEATLTRAVELSGDMDFGTLAIPLENNMFLTPEGVLVVFDL